MYDELQRAFGWDLFKKVFAEYRALPESQRPHSDDEKRDQFGDIYDGDAGNLPGPLQQEGAIDMALYAYRRARASDMNACHAEVRATKPGGTGAPAATSSPRLLSRTCKGRPRKATAQGGASADAREGKPDLLAGRD